MDVGGGGGFPSPATEEETIARKRSRRVSFAETTAVHVFDRDEDFERSPEEGAVILSPSPSPGRLRAGDAEEDEGTEEFLRPPFRFVGEVDSSSPGSAVGSVASNDDDNFFGPVSTSFILLGRPSDSGMSEDNHDITLDSQTFSLHFRNVAPPDDCSANSAGSLKTPNSESTGQLKELTGSESRVKSRSGQDALTDMSLFADNPERYDYAKLSPTLNNLLQKVKEVQEPKSSKDGTSSVTPDHALTLPASEEEHREETCIGNGISSNELGTVGSPEEHISMSNPVSSSIQEDNVTMVDIHYKSQNRNDHQIAVHPDVNKTVKTPAMLSPPYRAFMSNVDLQRHLLDQPLSKDQPPGANQIANASILSSAVNAFSMKDVEQLHEQNQVMDLETIPHTPRTVVQSLQIPQGSVSSLHSKRQQLFSPIALSTSNVVSQEACSLGSEFVKHGQRISALEDHVLKFRLHESPATHSLRLPLVERNELGLQPNNTASKAEDYCSTTSVSSNSVPRRQLKRISRASILGTPPRQELNKATEVHDTSCDVLALDRQPSHECNSLPDLDGGGRKMSTKENGHAEQEWPDRTAKRPRSPITSRKQLPCVSLSYCMTKENQSEAHDNGQSVNDDWNKVVFTISNATKQIFSTSISKLNLQQLDVLGDMLGEIQMARKYKRLSTAVRIYDCCNDQQNRLAEARSLHDKLLYEKAKLQINRVKLDKLQNKAQLCQVGIQECCYLKSKISHLCCPTVGASQMKHAPLHAATLFIATDRQDGLAIITEKRLELSMIQQKMENVKSSLECLCNIKCDISCDEVVRAAEEHLEMRNQCQIIHQQAWLWELNDLVKRENKRDVILNYCNLLFQRIILNISDMSGIFVNNSLGGAKIEQAFPNLNAFVAFNFVFKADENQRVSDLRSLQKKTMERSLLLGNLIDVLEEIKVSKMKLLNLTSTAFAVESQTGQLAFRLCFMSFKSGKRIAFTIDMTDLNSAVYPSEPSELLIKVCEVQTTVAQSSLDKLMVSIRDLQPGRMMILRLCRMVSQLVHALPG